MLGIAKRVRGLRPSDFHVVVASATIDPRAFIEFFAQGASLQAPPSSLPSLAASAIGVARRLIGSSRAEETKAEKKSPLQVEFSFFDFYL